MVDILAARKAYRRFEIAAIAFVAGQESPSDGLSKADDNGALMKLIELRKDLTKPIQWIKRDGVLMQIPPKMKE